MEVRPVDDNVTLRKIGTAHDSLISRQVNYEPLSNNQSKLTLYPIDQLNLLSNGEDVIRVQESLIVRDLIDNLCGLSGSYIRYNNGFDPYRGDIPEFKIAKKIDSSLKAIGKSTLQYGSYYVYLRNAGEKWCGDEYGVVLQRLSYEIGLFLDNVYLPIIVDKLERRFNEDVMFSIRELKQLLNDGECGKQLTLLYNLVVRIEEEMNKRLESDLNQLSLENFMNEMNEFNENDDLMPIFIERKISRIAKGGTILKILYQMILETQGDIISVNFLQNLLIQISDNYYKILNEWMSQGELNDPHEEFMIINTMPHPRDTDSNNNNNNIDILNPVECDRIWLTQYGIRKDGLLDKFNNDSRDGRDNRNNGGNRLLFKILTTGKLLNVIKMSLKIRYIPIRDEDFVNEYKLLQVNNFVELMESTNFELYIDKWYNRANKLCSRLLNDGYQLKQVMMSVSKWYFGINNDHNVERIYKDILVEMTRHYSNKQYDIIKTRICNKFNFLRRKMLNDTSGKYGLNDNDKMILKLMILTIDKESFPSMINNYIKSEIQTLGNSQINTFESLRDIVMQEFEQAQAQKEEEEEEQERDNTMNQRLNNIYYLKIDIGIPFPLNVIINRSCILQYQLINRYLNLLRYNNIILEETWIEINKNNVWKYKGFNDDIKNKIIRKSRLIINEMINFIKLIQEYFNEDVITYEMSRCFQEEDNEDQEDITMIQNKLSECLTNILHDGCLMEMMPIQLATFDIINKFCGKLLTMRNKLSQLDYYLSENNNNNNNSSHDYNENVNVIKTTEYIEFINQVHTSFIEHRDTFYEGVQYQYNRHDTASSSNITNSNDYRMLLVNVTHGARLCRGPG